MCAAPLLEPRVPFLDRKVMEVRQGTFTVLRISENSSKQSTPLLPTKSLPDEWAARPR